MDMVSYDASSERGGASPLGPPHALLIAAIDARSSGRAMPSDRTTLGGSAFRPPSDGRLRAVRRKRTAIGHSKRRPHAQRSEHLVREIRAPRTVMVWREARLVTRG